MQALQIPLLLIFPALAILGGLKDLTSYTIPNWISVALIVAFVPAALVSGVPLARVGLCLAVGVGALVAGMGMFAAGWIGGGDGKLFAVCALWLGWPAALPFLLYTGRRGSDLRAPGPALGLAGPGRGRRSDLATQSGCDRRRSALRRGHRHRRPGGLSARRSGPRNLILPQRGSG
jgi:hypothetical protein